jgi:hypothetical protein
VRRKHSEANSEFAFRRSNEERWQSEPSGVTKIPSHVVLLVMIYWPLCIFGDEHKRQGLPFALATRSRSYGHAIAGRHENETVRLMGVS